MAASGKESPGEVTHLLWQARDGDRGALDRLLPVVYEELRRVANRELGGERPDSTLDGTALVHEAYLKLAGGEEIDWQSRAHFYALAARSMRQILVDHARRRGARKRGGGWDRVTLRGIGHEPEVAVDDLLALDEALEGLGALDDRQRAVVEYRFFGGMSDSEIAAVLGVSTRTVEREWVKARAWLYRTLYGDPKCSTS